MGAKKKERGEKLALTNLKAFLKECGGKKADQ